MLALSAPPVHTYLVHQSNESIGFHLIALFVLLVCCKIVVGVSLVYYAASVRAQDAELFLRSPVPMAHSVHVSKPKGVEGAGNRDKDLSGPAQRFMDLVNEAVTDKSQRKATAAELAEQEQQERIEFMEELSGMERYTVYKGRVMG